MATKAKTKAKKAVKGKVVKSKVNKLKKPMKSKSMSKKKNSKHVARPIKKTVKTKVAPAKKKTITKPLKVKKAVNVKKAKAIVKVAKPVKQTLVAPKITTSPLAKVIKSKKAVARAIVKKIIPTPRKPVTPINQTVKDWSKIDLSLEIPPYQETQGEEYMNEKQRIHFRHILLQRRYQMLQEMGRTVHQMHDETATNLPDPNDRATQEEEFSLELRTRDRERKFIKNIEDALQKLDEGEYGYCDACGVEIGIRRLEARPTANLCIDCKTLDEIRERQIIGR